MSSYRLIAIPALADNYVWLLVDAQGDALIVDPGDAVPVLAAIARDHLIPRAILLTHHHPDHIGGVGELRRHYPSLPVVAPHDERIAIATRRVPDGDAVAIENPRTRFDVLEVSGHTSSHIAFFGGGVVFAGDTLFSVGCGRMFEGTAAQMLASLDRLRALPGDTQLCCGHEYTLANCAFALTVDPDNPALRERADQVRALRSRGEPTVPVAMTIECATNPFLRVDEPALRDAARRAIGAAADDRVARFAWLRARKDAFAAR